MLWKFWIVSDSDIAQIGVLINLSAQPNVTQTVV